MFALQVCALSVSLYLYPTMEIKGSFPRNSMRPEPDVSQRRHCLSEIFRDFGKCAEFSRSGMRHYRTVRIRTHNLTIHMLENEHDNLSANEFVYFIISLITLGRYNCSFRRDLNVDIFQQDIVRVVMGFFRLLLWISRIIIIKVTFDVIDEIYWCFCEANHRYSDLLTHAQTSKKWTVVHVKVRIFSEPAT